MGQLVGWLLAAVVGCRARKETPEAELQARRGLLYVDPLSEMIVGILRPKKAEGVAFVNLCNAQNAFLSCCSIVRSTGVMTCSGCPARRAVGGRTAQPPQ